MRRGALPLLLLAAVLAASGCDDRPSGERTRPTERGEHPTRKHGVPSAERAQRPRTAAQAQPKAALALLSCPRSSVNCAAARGTITYVEAVDPDGDGDAHFVLASRQSVTGPGISVIDVRRDLRPRPLPRAGDLVSAVGPVYRGSYGQRQIEATRLRVRR